MTRSSLAALCLPACLLLASPVFAQEPPSPPLVVPLAPEPISGFVIDARGAMGRFKQLPAIGTALGVDANTNLPGRGLGLTIGGHVYPLRRRSIALGLGGEVLLRMQGSRTVGAETENGPEGPTVTMRMSALSPQVSLNFGKRSGWSYLSGGIGWASFAAERADAPLPDAETRPRAINYGGGARWFAKERVAFSLDLRFYAISPQEATAGRPAFPRQTIMVIGAGVSMR